MRSRFKLIAFFLAPYRFRVALSFAVYLAYTLAEMAAIAALFPLVSSIAGGGRQQLNLPIRVIEHIVQALPFGNRIASVAALLVLTQIVKFALGVAFDVLNSRLTIEVATDLKRQIFEKFRKLPYDFFLRNKAGDILHLACSAPGRPAQAAAQWVECLVTIVKTAAIGAFLLSLSAKVTLLIAALGLIYQWANSRWSRNRIYQSGKERSKHSADANTVLQEFLAGVKQIRAAGAERWWELEFSKSNEGYARAFIRDMRLVAISSRSFEVIGMTIACLILGGLAIWDEAWVTQNLGLISVYLFALVRVVPAVSSIVKLQVQLVGNLPESEKVYAFLADEPTRPIRTGKTITSLSREIGFDQVSFAYPTRESTLKNLNLTFPKGQATAIVGSSGAGKSTIVSLLFGFYEASHGTIRVDGVPLAEVDPASWLKMIGYVSQDGFVYHASVHDNITFGREGLDRSAVVRAAKMAGAHEFIESLPQGYDTVVGEKGMRLSGGQQQRIAIARALVTDPEILIFDEATSSLDNVSERAIQETIDQLAKRKTLILIAHRLSTIANADRIYLLHHGQVVETGGFKELIAQGGAFAKLYQGKVHET